jgi:glutathione S-transferase
MEHRAEEFKQVNEWRHVPAIVEGDFKLGDSHAILTYLATTRNCAEHWYPKDFVKRAQIDQFLHWHHQTIRTGARLYFENFVKPIIGLKTNPAVVDWARKIYETALDIVEATFATGKPYLCGDEITLADLSLV